MLDDDSYITLEQEVYCELFAFKGDRDGLEMGGLENENPALKDLIELAKTHPVTQLKD